MLHSILLGFALLTLCASASQPVIVPWNENKTYGPDGPWRAITVGIGTDQSGNALNQVDLYPGGFAYHLIHGDDYCQTQTCPARDAGLFDYENSTTIFQNVTKNPGLAWTQDSHFTQKQTGTAEIVLDSIFVNTTTGTTLITNSSVDIVHGQQITLPDGSRYSPTVGTFAIGSPEGTRKYTNGNGNIAPNYLAGSGVSESASTSLHYGSASLGPTGSLIFGGYDQSRVSGEVGKFTISRTDAQLDLSLIDIGLDVETGASPFKPEAKTGLIKFSVPNKNFRRTTLNSVVSYFFMSKPTCDAIASNLPVTFDAKSGLYIWNSGDPKYKRLVTSPAFLSFTFRPSDSDPEANAMNGSTPTMIKVPLAVLNLTLQAPLTDSPQQYFPCYPFASLDNSDRFFLGRAFFQAAFVAMNFDESSFYLGQAPGPSPPASNIVSIQPDSSNLPSSSADSFAQSWKDHWTPFSALEAQSYLNTSTPTSKPTAAHGHRLSGGAIAGIVVGSIVGAALILLVAILLLLRGRKNSRRAVAEKDGSGQPTLAESDSQIRQPVPEMDDQATKPPIPEMYGQKHSKLYSPGLVEMGSYGWPHEVQGRGFDDEKTEGPLSNFTVPGAGLKMAELDTTPESRRAEMGDGKRSPELPTKSRS